MCVSGRTDGWMDMYLSVLVGDLQQQGQAAVVKVVIERYERPVHAAL